MTKKTTIIVPSHPRFLGIVRGVTQKVCEIAKIDSHLISKLKLAVDEACTNVIRHTYKGNKDKKIKVQYHLKKKLMKIEIEDSGEKVNDNVLKKELPEELRPGGLGVPLIKGVFDIVNFDTKFKKGNRLVLIKFLT